MRHSRRLITTHRSERLGIWPLALLLLVLTGCTTVFPDLSPPSGIPAEAKRISFTMIAKDHRCDPAVMAVDREGRSALVKVTIRSEGSAHVFSIPDLDVRRYLEPGQEATVEFLAERSGVFEYGCTRFPWISPLDAKGKLAIR